ncbi:MAG: ribonuclease Y [Erysipelotrichaceae bacterium]|nr:ribonuclease Y [Erysipelotrichaceae bacterium]
MSETMISILIFVLGLIIGISAILVINYIRNKKKEMKADSIIEKAKKDADKIKRESLFETKEEINKLKLEADKEVKEKKSEAKEIEDRILQREKNLDKRDEIMQNREKGLDDREKNLLKKQDEIQEIKEKMEEIKREQLEELERISGFTKEQARESVMKIVEEKMSKEIAAYIKERETEAKLDVDSKAKEMLVNCMQKYAADVTNEQTISVISLPNDEMKGRIIGREGRNVRTIESVTGVDLIIDDTPEAIVISSFDPLRREIARLTLETLIKDGRIHPARIEEVYDKMCNEVNQKIKEYGKNTIYELGLSRIDSELINIIGKLHFRTSYGQNALKHSKEVAYISGLLAAELGENVNLAKRAGLLHDIGKAIDFEMEGSHVDIGVDIAKKYNENKIVINAIASHHGDTPATSAIAAIVNIADTISASRPGARNDSSENYFQRLEKIEQIGNNIKGVDKAYAIQAGRELRVIVKPEEIDDLMSYQVARNIKEQIEDEVQYPGTIKVTVIRETRATEEAK